MGKHALAERNKERIVKSRGRLTPQQLVFAEWLAVPTTERQPRSQKELAKQLGVSQQSLCQWKEIPELWDVRDSLVTSAAKDLIPEAIKVLKDRIADPEHKKLALDAAKDILDRWSEPKRHAHIIASIKDMYESYKEE